MAQLLCGAAKEKITPSAELFPLMEGRGRKTTHALDDLFVRVIALKTGEEQFLLISFDLAGTPNPVAWVSEISDVFRVAESNILYFATHAHATPMVGFRNKTLTEAEVLIADAWHEALFKAVSTALENMQPARYGFGSADSYLNVNRNVIYRERDGKNNITREYCAVGARFDGPSDKTLAVVRFEDLFGKVIAFFVNYPMHLVAMHRNRCGEDGGMALSSDIGGLASQYMEDRFEGAVSMWSSGAAGDQNPLMMNRLYYPSPENNEMQGSESNDYQLCVAQAARHFDDILLINDTIVADREDVEMKSGVGYSRTPARTVDLNSDSDKLGRNVDIYKYSLDTENTYDVRIQLIQIGDLVLVGVSGELYSSIGSLMKSVSSMKNTVIVTHAMGNDNVYSGYIYDDEGCTMGANGGLYHYNSRILPGYVPSEMCRVMLNLLKEQ